MKNTRWIIVTMVLVVLTVLGVLIYRQTPGQRIKRYLSLGEKYLAELEYEDAILAFEEVIKIDHMSAKAYVGLAKANVGLRRYRTAKKELLKGIYITNDETLKRAYFEILKEARTRGKRISREVIYEDGDLVEETLYYYDSEGYLDHRKISRHKCWNDEGWDIEYPYDREYFWEYTYIYYDDYDVFDNCLKRREVNEPVSAEFKYTNHTRTVGIEGVEILSEIEYTYYDYCLKKDEVVTSYQKEFGETNVTTMHYEYEFDEDGNLLDTKMTSDFSSSSVEMQKAHEAWDSSRTNNTNIQNQNEYDDDGCILKRINGNRVTQYEYEYPKT